MAEARARIDQALRRGEPIAVHGDYDADGITATFLLVERPRASSAPTCAGGCPTASATATGSRPPPSTSLRPRASSCSSPSTAASTRAPRWRAPRRWAWTSSSPTTTSSRATCPTASWSRPSCGGYPCPHLAGVGVAFKLAHALLEEPGDELVELPLALRAVHRRRRRRHHRRRRAARRARTACSRPSGSAGCAARRARVWRRCWRSPAAGPARVDAGDRRLPPRAAAQRRRPARGRLDRAGAARRRRPRRGAAARAAAQRAQPRAADHRGRRCCEAAVAMVPDPPPPALVLSSPDWHEGVVGIVASRVAERFHRPAILLSEGDDEAKGSGRSIPAFDLLGAVERTSGHLLTFGGHRAACGLRLRRDAIPAFREAFVAEAAAALGPDDLRRVRARRRHRRRRRAHARPRRRARAARAARVRQPPGDAAAARRRGGRAAAHARQAARAVPRALRRRLVPGHPLQLRRPRRAHRARAARRGAGAHQERVQRRR